MPASHPAAIEQAVFLLQQGQLVCFPTDTVYGIGAAASQDEAIRRLYSVKGRLPDQPLPLLLSDPSEASWYGEVTPVARTLIGRFWPGPLTIVLRKVEGLRSRALAGKDTVALRVPADGVPREMVRMLGEPLTGTSANRTGARPPVSAAEVAFSLGEMVSLVIDGGRSPVGVESTVVDLSAGAPAIVREGAVSREELVAVLGRELEVRG
ncbi:MAG TPA: L-threonylcarbamoyladenylate synthase [Dehalococcoidia bacterium]|nr:L-threonylcarbamoyladenylate synthase [Dehalococcoidia bacterium]